MAGALTLGDYLIDHALAVFDLMGTDQVSDDAHYVLRWLVAHGRETFNARDLYTANRTRFPTAAAVAPAIARLKDFCWVRPQPWPAPTGRGRPPSEIWAVNPLAHQQKHQNGESPGR